MESSWEFLENSEPRLIYAAVIWERMKKETVGVMLGNMRELGLREATGAGKRILLPFVVAL